LLALVNQANSKYGALTPDGGNYSATKEDSSPTCGITEFSMSTKVKIKSIKRLLSTRDMVEETKSGEFNTLMLRIILDQ
jgi:hypothetical protein